MVGWIILGAAALLLLICVLRALALKPAVLVRKPAVSRELDADAIAQRVAGALRFRTVSTMDPRDTDWAEFLGLHDYIEKTYPLVHQTLAREKIEGYSLLYHWKGKDAGKLPILLMAHQDVVPVAPETLSQWKHGAFSGDIADGYIWGRGALDMKGQLMSILEAAEYLIGKGFVPSRDIYFAFGHNEEVMNETGAQETSKALHERGIRFAFVLDEGGTFLNGKSFGVDNTLALIGICEKGYADVKLTAKASGGHASTPPKHTALGKVARAVTKIENKPMRSAIAGPTARLFDAVAPHMGFGYRLVFANRWLFGGLLRLVLSRDKQGNALVRTTNAATMAQGSLAPNVLPQVASTIVNFRIAPWDDSNKVLEHVIRAVGDSGVEATLAKADEPSGVSAVDNEEYGIVAGTISQIYPDMVVAPYPMVAATDSRYYQNVCGNIYRFVPFRSMLEDMDTVHANNERVGVESMREAVDFFATLIENANA